MFLKKENEVYKVETEVQFTHEATITFKQSDPVVVYKQQEYDWYMTVALEKSDQVKEDRHLLTASLLINYRNAIREGFNHQLDSTLKNRYDYPRNRNTIKGIQDYINRIDKASKAEMDAILKEGE